MMMNWQRWLDKRDIQQVKVTDESLKALLGLVERDLADARVAGVSADRRFATAYNAALNLANYVIRKQGYRVNAKIGHHRVTLRIAGDVLGEDAKEHINYFDLCRRHRNKLDYDLAGVVTEKQVEELITQTEAFKDKCLKG